MGHSGATIDLGTVNSSKESVQEYLAAVGNDLPIYNQTGLAPPLYFAASALSLLLLKLDLPSGAVHSLQEIDTIKPWAMGKELRVLARLERPRKRLGLTFITAACDLLAADGKSTFASKSTVMLMGDGPDGDRTNRAPYDRSALPIAASELPVVTRTVTQYQLDSYAHASGDSNPLHLDAGFAAGTQFGGIIAHGMLTLAWIGEMMAAAYGRKWLEAGSLRVRFKGAAYLEDRIETWASATKDKSDHFTVAVMNSRTGQELVTGNATLKVN